jgi:hypothetical protein
VIIGATGLKLVPVANKLLSKGTSIRNDLLSILLELWHGDLVQGSSDSSDGVVMGTTLASREDSLIDTLFEIFGIFQVLPEEDETGTRTTEGLVAGREHQLI